MTRMAYAQSGNTTLPDFSYSFDAASNITRKKFEHRSGTPTEDYNYDTLHRLTRTDFGQRTSTPYESFVYDDLGNHLTQNDNGTEIAGLFNAVDEQTKRDGVDVLYDRKGNLTKDDIVQVYVYDRQNLLTRVEDGSSNRIASYAYDAFNRRIEKDVNGGAVTRFYWTDGWQLLEETDDAGTPAAQRYYVWGNYIDELLMFRDVIGTGGTANADYFACRHHNYNLVALLDDTGAVVERYDYNPYGKRFVLDNDYSADADGVSDFGLTIGHQGKMHDEETGLMQYNWRMYSPRLGRFVTPDMLNQNEPSGGYHDGMNRYQYVLSNPINLHDITGLAAGCCSAKIVATPAFGVIGKLIEVYHLCLEVDLITKDGERMSYQIELLSARDEPQQYLRATGAVGGLFGSLGSSLGKAREAWGIYVVPNGRCRSSGETGDVPLPSEECRIARALVGSAISVAHQADKKVAYRLKGPNSNSFIGTVLRSLSLHPEGFDVSRAPGYGVDFRP